MPPCQCCHLCIMVSFVSRYLLHLKPEKIDLLSENTIKATTTMPINFLGTMCKTEVTNCRFWTWERQTKTCYFKSSDSGLQGGNSLVFNFGINDLVNNVLLVFAVVLAQNWPKNCFIKLPPCSNTMVPSLVMFAVPKWLLGSVVLMQRSCPQL